MSEHPDPPPAATASLPPAGAGSVAPFFAVSLTKLAVMSVCSLGLYQMYWFFSNWRRIQAQGERTLSPVARTVFAVVFAYSCFQRIAGRGQQLAIPRTPPMGWLALAWLVCVGAAYARPPWNLLSLASSLFLLPVQRYANAINRVVAPDHDGNTRLTAWNWIAIVIFALLLVLVAMGSLLPAPDAD